MVRSQTSFHSRQSSLRSNTSKIIAKKLDKKNPKCLPARSVGKIRNGGNDAQHTKELSTSDPESKTDAGYMKKSRFTRFAVNKAKKGLAGQLNPTQPRLVAGEDLPAKIRMEHQGREILQVIEELMDQASILKERLVNMIDYFQDTIGACTNMLQQSSEFRQPVCTCKSGCTLASHCRSKAGCVAPSDAKERYSLKETHSCAETEKNIELPKLPFQRSYIPGLSHKSEQLRPIREDHALSAVSPSWQIAPSVQCSVPSVHTTPPESCICVRDLQYRSRHNEGDLIQKPQKTYRTMRDQPSKATKITKVLSDNEISCKDTLMNYTTSQQQGIEDEKFQKTINGQKQRTDGEKNRMSSPQSVSKEKKATSKSKEKPGETIATQQIISEVQPTTSIAPNPEIEDRLQQVQRDIQELQKLMAMCATCTCTDRLGDHATAISQTMSGQLLGKANDIQALLNDLKFDCYQRVNMSKGDLPDTGKQMVTQKCEKQIQRVHPEFTRTVNQTQQIEADRKHSGDIQTAKVVETLEIKIGTKYNDDNTSENVILNTKVEAIEKLKKQRETKTQVEKTAKITDQSHKEVNIIDEDDVIKKGAKVITTTEKVVRTEILDGTERREQVITNVIIRRVIDNKTGVVTETITDANKDIKTDGKSVDASKVKVEYQAAKKTRGKDGPCNIKLSTQDIDMQPEQLYASKILTNGKESSIPDDSQESISQFICKRSYKDDDVPPVKMRRTAQLLVTSDLTDKTHGEVNGNNNYSNEREQAGGAYLRETCSKVRYTLPNSGIPGVNYIGCKDSDMAKYPIHRSKISTNKRLIVDPYTSKKSMRVSDPNRYPSMADNYPSMKISDSHALAGSEREVNTTLLYTASNQTGAGGKPEVKPDNPTKPLPSKIEQQSAINPTNAIDASLTNNTTNVASNRVSKSLKPSLRDRKYHLNRSQGGTSFEVTGLNRLKQQQPSSSRDPELTTSVVPSSQPVESIEDLIRNFSDSRSPDDFFVSILPERIEFKQFRINVIDKESGKLLGHFFINEAQFKQARDEGVFDNYLSLFVLNSLGSYSDFF